VTTATRETVTSRALRTALDAFELAVAAYAPEDRSTARLHVELRVLDACSTAASHLRARVLRELASRDPSPVPGELG
jgi:hypothetical protein